MRLVFEFVNIANGLTTDKKLAETEADKEGSKTLAFLKKVAVFWRPESPGRILRRSGLHPAVYFYGATGRYQPPAFLAACGGFIQELEEHRQFNKFTAARARFENFLLTYRYFTNQVIGRYGSGTKSMDPLVTLDHVILDGVTAGKTDKEIVADLQSQRKLNALKEMTEEDREYRKNFFSPYTKLMAFLRDALQNALRCKNCGARIHKQSISIDHIERKEDGGRGDVGNAQLTHPYCNSGYKESEHAKAKASSDS